MGYSQQVKDQAIVAKDYLKQNGLHKGDYFNRNGACCVFGAVRIATKLDHDHSDLAQAVANELRLYLDDVPEWNDADARTQEEVEAVLDRIANS